MIGKLKRAHIFTIIICGILILMEMIISSMIYYDFNSNNSAYIVNLSLNGLGFNEFKSFIKESKQSYDLTFNERLRYYLSNKWYTMYLENKYINIKINKTAFLTHNHINTVVDTISLYSYKYYVNKIYYSLLFFGNRYRIDFNHLLRKINFGGNNDCNSMLLTQFGDRPIINFNASETLYNYKNNDELPILKKTRYINNTNVIPLQTFKAYRHWGFWKKVDKHDISYNDKISTVVWRGLITGYTFDGSLRHKFNEIYSKYKNKSEINVLNTNWDNNENKMSIKELLTHKYIVVIQGNDVATSLPWVMYSNSVPFILEPILKESWAMQGLLIPYKHYIPITLYNNSVINAYKYCQNNPIKCNNIAQNGKRYMKQFKDHNFNLKLQQKIIEIVCKITRFDLI